MNDISKIKEKVVLANSAYRSGNPIMSDQQFDDLCDELQKSLSADKWNSFRDSLHEVKGKVKHPYIMGSLDKLKAEEPTEVSKFVNAYCRNTLNVSAKIDGISCRLHYENGKLVSASTRGDGTWGEDLTDKIQHVKFVPQQVTDMNIIGKDVDIRGELVILKKDFEKLTGFANARNAVAGIMGRKEWTADDMSHVSFIAYTILGNRFTKSSQFKTLKLWGFNTAWNTEICKPYTGIVDELFDLASQKFEYDTDGLVLADSEYVNEEKYRPDACKAFKINQLVGETTLLDVVFDGPAKDGTHTPVGILEPINLGGSMISRVTIHNLDILKKHDLKYGSIVRICKSGDVIPKLVCVVSEVKGAQRIEIPEVCNCCHSPLVRDGVNLRCMNKECGEQKLTQVYHFIMKLGVKHAAKKSLENFGITDFDKLLAWKPDMSKKMQSTLWNELSMKVFTRSRQELFAALNFRGLGETLINRIVDFYGMDNVIAESFTGLPSGVGEATLEKFKDSLRDNLSIVDKIINDSRYNYVQSSRITSGSKVVNKNGMSVCFTGKLNTMSRGEAEKKAIAAGFEVKGVNKKLTYLVTNDTDSGSSKNKKAKELGIKVISENEFLKLIDNTDSDSDVLSL